MKGQSNPLFVPSVIKTNILLNDDPAQQDRVIKICADAGFLKTVEFGQYFMTKHTDEFSQFTEPVTCREYTLPRDEKSCDPIPILGPCLTSQPLTCKVKMEWKLEMNL